MLRVGGAMSSRPCACVLKSEIMIRRRERLKGLEGDASERQTPENARL
jgi:hypothetical protein